MRRRQRKKNRRQWANSFTGALESGVWSCNIPFSSRPPEFLPAQKDAHPVHSRPFSSTHLDLLLLRRNTSPDGKACQGVAGLERHHLEPVLRQPPGHIRPEEKSFSEPSLSGSVWTTVSGTPLASFGKGCRVHGQSGLGRLRCAAHSSSIFDFPRCARVLMRAANLVSCHLSY